MESTLTYSQSQWDIVLAAFVMATFALFACFIYLINTRHEVAPRFRTAALAGSLVCLVATLAYVLLTVSWITGFDFSSQTFSPSDSALQFRNAYRYVDWSVTVPLLCIELVIVSRLAGAKRRRTMGLCVALAWLMIVTGFLGADTFSSDTGRLIWGVISTVFFIPLYVILLRTAFSSARQMGGPAGTSLRNAALMLSWTWGVYPIAYCVPFFFADSAEWAVGRQLAFTVADIAAKIGFGLLIHNVAKHRSAAEQADDTRDGVDSATGEHTSRPVSVAS